MERAKTYATENHGTVCTKASEAIKDLFNAFGTGLALYSRTRLR